MSGMEGERGRAALWSAYFALRTVNDPPDFIAQTRRDLKQYLDETSERKQPARGAKLSLVEPGNEHDQHQLREVAEFKYHYETALRRVVSSRQAINVIERFLGDPMNEILTVEDLPRHSRDAIAALRGVGSKTMIELDGALVERGLQWADEGRPALVVANGA